MAANRTRMCNRKKTCFPYFFQISIVISSLLWCAAALAQETPSDTDSASLHDAVEEDNNIDEGCIEGPCAPLAQPPSRILTFVDKTHAGISHRLEETVKRADRFFADDNVFEESKKSYARLPLDVIYDQDDGLQFKIRAKARINLPNTNKKLKLIFEDINAGDDPSDISETPADAVEDNNYSLALETQLKKTGKWKVRPALGIKANLPPDVFVRLRAIRYYALSEKWLSRLSATSSYLAVDGFENDGLVQFSRAIRHDILFRSSSRLKWTEENDFSDATQIFSFYQRLNEKVNLAYEAGVFSNNADNWEVSEYRLWHRYRKLAYKNWLFLEVIPELRFKKDNDYDPSYRITFRIEPFFGKDLPARKINRVD